MITEQQVKPDFNNLPNSLIVPTNDPSQTVAEYAPLGYRWEQLYVGKFYQKICEGKMWAVALFRPEKERQKELL